MNEQKTIEQKLLATHAYMRAVQEREKAFEDALMWAGPKTYTDEIHAMRRAYVGEKDRLLARASALVESVDPDVAEVRLDDVGNDGVWPARCQGEVARERFEAAEARAELEAVADAVWEQCNPEPGTLAYAQQMVARLEHKARKTLGMVEEWKYPEIPVRFAIYQETFTAPFGVVVFRKGEEPVVLMPTGCRFSREVTPEEEKFLALLKETA